MLDKKIKVTISPLGQPTVEAIGFNGQGCTAATEGIEKALSGSGGVAREYKEEWSQEDAGQTQELHQTW